MSFVLELTDLKQNNINFILLKLVQDSVRLIRDLFLLSSYTLFFHKMRMIKVYKDYFAY